MLWRVTPKFSVLARFKARLAKVSHRHSFAWSPHAYASLSMPPSNQRKQQKPFLGLPESSNLARFVTFG